VLVPDHIGFLVHDHMSMAAHGLHTYMLVQNHLLIVVPGIRKSLAALRFETGMLVPGGLMLVDVEGSSQAYHSKLEKQGDGLDVGVSSDKQAATWNVDQAQGFGDCLWSGWLRV
jgi:hypothetical protein